MFLNYTPHTIHLNDGRSFESVGLARVQASFTSIENDVCSQTFGEVTGLPEPQVDTFYIVSALVLAATQKIGRTDCVAPATGHPNCVRKDGMIVSVPGFVR